MTATRRYDLVVWGATGFTGELVSEYLLGHAPEGFRWAIGGRNQTKLETVRGRLAERFPQARDLPLVVGDSQDAGHLARMAGDARVICTTVGPYAKHGEPLVAACAAAGTHYCDLTGETQFIRRTIDAHHERARASGARIVHCCGFDSIPSDLGVLMMGEEMARRGGRLDEVRFFAGESRGTASGGTLASILNVIDEARQDRAVRKILLDPYALNPAGERTGPDGADQAAVRYDRELGMWTGPFVMASINTRVVRRSHALRGYPYGRDFRYSEAMSFGAGPTGLARAAGMTAGIGAFLAAMNVGPLKRLIVPRLPSPGEGPSREARENGFFVIRLLGRGTTTGGDPVRFRGRVEGDNDPGYGQTAKMLGESALCLALDELSSEGGVLTPAYAMGTTLLARLRAIGMRFDITG